ncbi:MAG: tetraacyldisaccharide 4'-kinase [Hyphomicrobiaceae bacterium]|nr:tetraacyldisaccharide 4'-kinase [Hyphomicrobiaceae bacterium]
MRLDEPSWWYRPGDTKTPAIVRLLRPASLLYSWAVERRFQRARPYRASLPVICIGNLTAGGTGKTPLAIRIAEELAGLGERPAFLTRGYGGQIPGPHWVDPKSDRAAAVGDEPLLLAATAPTVVSRDRAAGARAIESAGAASVIVMDDGLQNTALAKDLAIAVVDARRGFGNGEVLPAGPLRAGLGFQLGLADAILVTNPPGSHADPPSEIVARLRRQFPGPVLTAAPVARDGGWVRGARVVAFAGIANPQRFFHMLADLGGHVAATVPLPDHHAFSAKDAEHILALAAAHDAIPVTTEKDRVRLEGGHGAIGELMARSRVLAIRLVPDERDAMRLTSLIGAALGRAPSG